MSEAKTVKRSAKNADAADAKQTTSRTASDRPRLRDAERTSKAILAAATKEFA